MTPSRSMISMFLSATAAAIGCPPNVMPCMYMWSWASRRSAMRSENSSAPIGW